ncbi:MAG: GNAT family N-acetyltransferase [Bacillota bacterium]|nr:GNAT family N-acetyltransferase [Bacillota bacterium]
MNTRYSVKSDLPEIKHVWNTCFPGDIGYGIWFFENVWKAENTLVCCEENRIASMLQMLPTDILINGSRCKATYIYGACTMPRYRRQRLMEKLLNLSFAEDEKNNRPISVLIPQQEWLFDFYKKFSYESVFSLQTERMKVNRSYGEFTVRPFNIHDIKAFLALYDQKMEKRAHVVRTEKDAGLILDSYAKNGGAALCVTDKNQVIATAFGYVSDCALIIQELLVKDGFPIDEVCGRICGYVSCRDVKFSMPTESGGTCERFACARLAPWSGITADFDNAYMNLLFN